MLKSFVNNIQKIPRLGARKRKTRKVFGFWCDPSLRVRVKVLARALGIPIYPLSEHLLSLGLAHICAQLDTSAEEQEKVMTALREHLQSGHLLVDKVAHDEEVFVTGAELNPHQAELLKASMSLMSKMEEEGITPDYGAEILGAVSVKLHRSQVRKEKQQQLRRELDLEMLREIHTRYPRLIPEVYKVMASGTKKEMAEFLASK